MAFREKRFCPFCSGPLIIREMEGRRRLYCEGCAEPLYENPVPAVCVIVSDDAGRLLLVRRAAPPKVGTWCLPGGFMELGESPVESALREMTEETGLTGEVDRLLGAEVAPNALYGNVVVICYTVRNVTGRPLPGDDADAVTYFPLDALPEVGFGSHRKFIQAYREERDGHSEL